MISTSCEGKDTDKKVSTPPHKKLKQAVLSFQKLSPKVDVTSPKTIKKRKISEDSCDEIKVVKVIKSDNEYADSPSHSNSKEIPDGNEVEQIKSSEQEIIIIDSSEKESTCSRDLDKKRNEVTECADENNETVKKEELNVISQSDAPLSEKDISEEREFSSNDLKENDSDSSESLSFESSESDNEANETTELNSSSSCLESKCGDINSKSDIELTPKNKEHVPLKKKKLTPKQLQKREEIAKRREEKEILRKQKEKKRAEQKEVKRKEQMERKERIKKEKEEKEEQKRKMKEEKERKKQAELEQKSEEKRLKEEERRKKEEQRVLEKRKKDEKKLAEEEIKKKEAAAFANFFVATKGESKLPEEDKVNAAEHFMPFQVKADMRLAPVARKRMSESQRNAFDVMLGEQKLDDLYLQELKKNYVPGNSGKTWPLSEFKEDEDDDVIPISDDNKVVELHPNIVQPKAKLLMFYENRRPPYRGTWSKKSKFIKPKRPFSKDQEFFDYDVDSDDEWEEEEPGESLHGSDDEKESEDEYEVDNEFFVPHGYLSEEENNEEEENTTPESMQAKLKFMEMEFEEEMKHKTERIKPRLFGCFWMNTNTDQASSRVLTLLNSYRAVFQDSPIVLIEKSTPEDCSPLNDNQGACRSTGSKRKHFPESFVPALIKLVHGNINGRSFLVKEFSSYIRTQLQSAQSETNIEGTPSPSNAGMISKLKISEKIKEIASWIACPEEGPFLNRMCWYVPTEIKSAYGLEDLIIPNKVWKYSLTPRRELELSNTIPSPVVNDLLRTKSLPLITKFTKKMSQEKQLKQLADTSCAGDGEVEFVKEIKLLQENGREMSKRGEIKKANSMEMDSDLDSLASPLPVKSSPDLLEKNRLKHLSEKSIHSKLLQFKAKSSSIIPQLEQRKKVAILKSVPLGQTISSSTLPSTFSVNRNDNKAKEDNHKSEPLSNVISLD